MLSNVNFFWADTGVEGSGDDGAGSQTVSLDVFRECSDRVMMPCDFEEFITVSTVLFICVILDSERSEVYCIDFTMMFVFLYNFSGKIFFGL